MRRTHCHRCLILLMAICCAAQDNQQPDKQKASKDPKVMEDLLAMDLQSLLNVKVVTASKSSETMERAPGMMSVVSSDELHRFPSTSLREILERVAGFSVSSTQFTDRSLLAMRGDQTQGTGAHILFLIDGRPVREVLEGGVISDLLESFPVGVLERIEVIRGPGSVLYGSNAFSGVVNLITRKGEGNGLAVRAFTGGRVAQGASGELMFEKGGWNVLGGMQTQSSSGWMPAFHATPYGGGAPFQRDVDIASRGLGAFVRAEYKGLSLRQSYTGFNAPYTFADYAGRAKWARSFTDLGYGFHIGSNWESNVNLTFSRATFESNNFPSIDRDSHEVLLEWSNSVTLSSRDKATFGGLLRRTKGYEYLLMDPEPILATKASRGSGATYFQIEHALTDKLFAIGGLQMNKIAGISWNAAPRLALVWSPSPHVTLKGLYSTAFRAPSLNETNIRNPSIEGNLNLVPERMRTFDTGVTFQGRNAQASINYFHSQMLDGIALDYSGFPLRYGNLGRVNIQGVEWESKLYCNKQLFVSGSLAYLSSTKVPSLAPLVSQWNPKAGVSYKSTRGFSANVFDLYIGGLDGYSMALNVGTRRAHLLSADLRYDLSKLTHTGSNVTPQLFVHGYNLTNRSMWVPQISGVTDFAPLQRGRLITFGLEFALKSGR